MTDAEHDIRAAIIKLQQDQRHGGCCRRSVCGPSLAGLLGNLRECLQ